MKKLSLCALTMACAASLLALPVQAQKNRAPASNSSPQWEQMATVTFGPDNVDRKNNVPQPSRVDTELARLMWEKEIRANDPKLPSTVLISTVQHNGKQFTFSILDSAAAPGCISAANGRYVTDMYSVCPMRVLSIDGNTDKRQVAQFNNYCHLFPFAAEKPGAKNQTQFWFDQTNSIAYFRVIQNGQLVPDCNKAMQVK